MSVPNLKQISLFGPKLLGGPKISKLGHVTRARPLRGRFIIRMEGGSILYVPNLKWTALFVQKLLGGPLVWVEFLHSICHASLSYSMVKEFFSLPLLNKLDYWL